MKSEHIIELLKSLGSKRFKEYNGWISSDCPMSSWTHKKGRDANPSFNVSISDDATSVYYCYTCSDKYMPLNGLIGKFWDVSKQYPEEAAKILMQHENINSVKEEVNRDTVIDRWENYFSREGFAKIPEAILDRFPLLDDENSPAFKYICQERGISPEAIKHFGVRVFDLDSTMIFPMTNLYGDIIVMQARPIGEKHIYTISAKMLGIEWMEFPKVSEVGAWFGMHKVDWEQPVLIMEGCFDVMKAFTFGFKNCIAPFGAHITKAQASVLHSRAYILGMDSDDAGKKGQRQISGLLGHTAPISYVNWFKFCGVKDCGDVPDRDTFWKAINNRSLRYE